MTIKLYKFNYNDDNNIVQLNLTKINVIIMIQAVTF